MPSFLTHLVSKSGLGRMTTSEYQANLAGMNTFFGAVLGFVMTGTEKLDNLKFGLVLVMLAAVVISILFISNSRQRVFYAVYAVAAAATFPEMVDFMFKGQGLIPDKIRPTLLAWTFMTIGVEFWARERPETAEQAG